MSKSKELTFAAIEKRSYHNRLWYVEIGCANPPLGLYFISASIYSGDQYIREHQATICFHQKIVLGVPQGGVNHTKVEFQSSWNSMLWVV